MHNETKKERVSRFAGVHRVIARFLELVNVRFGDAVLGDHLPFENGKV